MARKTLAAPIALAALAFAGPATGGAQTERQPAAPPISLQLTRLSDSAVRAEYRLARPASALHFTPRLDGYRASDWQPLAPGFRWVREEDGERIERIDGKRFARLGFDIPVRYPSLDKSYASFSPFSDGGMLVYSGHYQACPALPCQGTEPLAVTIAAPGAMIGVGGKRTSGTATFVSREEGTNIYIGNAEPVTTAGFLAIVDPSLQPDLRGHLLESLPQSMRDFATIYGELKTTPNFTSRSTRSRDQAPGSPARVAHCPARCSSTSMAMTGESRSCCARCCGSTGSSRTRLRISSSAPGQATSSGPICRPDP